MNPRLVFEGRSVGRTLWLASALVACGVATVLADTAAAPTAASMGLRQYVLPDHTASAMLPESWKVTQTGVAFIQAQGPSGELAMFGVLIPAHDGSATSVTPTVLNQPYSASPKDKFTQSLTWVRTRNGKSMVPIRFVGEKPITPAPKGFGTCTNLTAVLGAEGQGQLAVETDMCSMPADGSGNYKNFFKVVGLPLAQAAAERAQLEAILGSFQLNPSALQQAQRGGGSAPVAANGGARPFAQGGGNGSGNGSAVTWAQAIAQINQMNMNASISNAYVNELNRETMATSQAATNSANNFDMGVLRGDTPVYAVGQSQPLFWIGD